MLHFDMVDIVCISNSILSSIFAILFYVLVHFSKIAIYKTTGTRKMNSY